MHGHIHTYTHTPRRRSPMCWGDGAKSGADRRHESQDLVESPLSNAVCRGVPPTALLRSMAEGSGFRCPRHLRDPGVREKHPSGFLAEAAHGLYDRLLAPAREALQVVRRRPSKRQHKLQEVPFRPVVEVDAVDVRLRGREHEGEKAEARRRPHRRGKRARPRFIPPTPEVLLE